MPANSREEDPAEVGKRRRSATDGTASVYSESIANAPNERKMKEVRRGRVLIRKRHESEGNTLCTEDVSASQ